MSTIKEVASRAQVARSTVSRVINGGSVAEDTRQRVMSVMQELGFQPNTIARSLATSRTGSLGMVVSDMEGPFFGPLMKRAEEVIRAQNRHLIVTSGHGNRRDELDAVDFLLERRCDALLLHVDEMTDDELIAVAAKVPTVIMNRRVPELSDQCVYLDNELGGYLATRHLLQHGHVSIGHISGPLRKQDSRERLHGYRTALEEAGIPFNPALVVEGDFQDNSGYQAVQKLLGRMHAMSAIFCANDQIAFGAIQALKDQNIRVPEDISIVGFDNILFARYISPQLTTLHYPVDLLGEVSAKMAMDRIDQQTPSLQQRLVPELISRQTVASFRQRG